EGFARVYESDMLALPDPTTFQVLPWRNEPHGTARMYCDILMPDGSPSYADPRNVLKRQLSKASDLGFTFYTHPEIEFYLLKKKPGFGELPEPNDDGGYFDHTPHNSAHDFRRSAIMMLEDMGISVEFSHHEGGPGQDRKSTRLNSSHVKISYAVFCLKKKKTTKNRRRKEKKNNNTGPATSSNTNNWNATTESKYTSNSPNVATRTS